MTNGPDWGIGAYEVFAHALEPAARHLVDLAAPVAGERAIDLGCGSGNATLPLAESGAHVTAVDPSLRLLGIATQRARAAGFSITTSLGGAESVPLPDNDADLIVSNFGIIFSGDAEAAIQETLRVLAPGGRLFYTAWLPEGPIAEVGALMRRTIAAEAGNTAAAPAGVPAEPDSADQPSPADDLGRPLAPLWHEPATLAHVIPGGESAITVHSAQTDFVSTSAQAWMDEQETNHPMWLAARNHVGSQAAWRELMQRSTALLAAHSHGTDEFRVTSPYVVVEVRPTR